MPAEIGASPPLPPVSAPRPLPPAQSQGNAQADAEMTLKLVQTLAGLLGEGESGKAEVLAVKEGLANNFQVLLKLTLANSGQSLVEVQSNRRWCRATCSTSAPPATPAWLQPCSTAWPALAR